MNKCKKAFTLVELIVVITILAILGTIAFISMQSYSAHARDSTRISDLSAMKTSLELFQLDAGKYPDPTEGFIVTYSGSEVWTQGIFGTTTFSNISKLDKIPKDPLTEKEYTYSVTKTKQEYQFAGIVEGEEISLNSNIGQTSAGDNIAIALVTGTYNGQMIKTESGTNCNILSLPSIISSEPNTTTDLSVILSNESLVYNGYKNLPTNYLSSKYKTDGGFEFESNKLVVYDDSASCTPLYNPEDNTARVELVTNLQQAYSGTLIENEDDISGVVNINLLDTDKLNIISATLINNNLGGDIAVSNLGSSSIEPSLCILTQDEVESLNELVAIENEGSSGMNAYIADTENEYERNEIIPITEDDWCNNVKGIAWYGGSTIPLDILKLTNLKYLSLSSNNITVLPSEIMNLTNLIELDLSWNNITNFGFLSSFTNLTNLGVSNNGLEGIPTEILNSTKLIYLSLSDNPFGNLPPEIGNLVNLKSILLRNNGLTNLPSEIGSLIKLERMDLGDNGLITLPSEIENLTSLKYLHLGDNSLTTLPPEIGSITNLNELHLYNNSLTSITPEIGNLTNMEYLYLSYNSLTGLPADIKNLTNLKILRLQQNPLLGNISYYYDIDSGNRSQLNIPTTGKTMTIGGNGTKIVITISL